MLNTLRVTLNREKNDITYSQGKRYRRIISNDTKFKENILHLRNFFLERNYPVSIVDEALGNACSLSQDEALQTSIKNGDKISSLLWLNTILLCLT